MNNNSEETNQVYQALERICLSKSFRDSPIYSKILTFLVEAYFEKLKLKEALIEVKLFQHSSADISYDGKVRVYMFNLRNKLDEYYQQEGQNDPLIFRIEKGQYNLSIERRKVSKTPYKLLLALVVVAIIIAGIFYSRLSNNTYLWATFLEDEIETICYVGDHFTLRGKDATGLTSSIYVDGVNSETELRALHFRDTLPWTTLDKAQYSFVTKMGPVSAAALSSWFTQYKRHLTISLGSELALDELKRNNIIYIGPYKGLYRLEEVFLKSSKKFALERGQIIHKQTGEVMRDSRINERRDSYVMVSFNRFSDRGNSILLFAGNNDIGVIAAVEKFTNPKELEAFYAQLPSQNAQFNALFKVAGIGRTDLGCELVELEVLED